MKEPISDAQWAAFRERPDAQSFAPIYESTRALVYTLCFRVTGDRELALDAFQAAYARLLAELRASSSTGSTAPNQFIARLALREAWSHAKRRDRRARKEFAMDQLPLAIDPALPADAQAAQRQLREQIETLILVLPERERLPLQLHYFHGLSQTEIAATLEVDKSTVSRRIERGLKRLQPLVRRAGLGENLALLAPLAAGAALLEPPKAMAAAFLFAQASAGAAALIAGNASLTASSTMIGGLVVKAKTALWGAAAMLAMLGAATVVIAQSRAKPAADPAAKTAAVAFVSGQQPQTSTPSPAAAAARSTLPDQKSAVPASSASAVPAGLLASVLVLVNWEGTQAPVPGTTVTLTASGIGMLPQGAAGVTDAHGLVRLSFPEAAPTVRVFAVRGETQQASAVIRSTRFGASGGGNARPVEEPVVLTLKPGANIFGVVRRAEDHAPVFGVEVAAFAESGAIAGISEETDSEGRFTIGHLPRGAFRMQAFNNLYSSDLPDPKQRPIELAAGGNYGPVEILVRPAVAVEGFVRDKATGKPIAGASVSILTRRANEAMRSGASGRFQTEGLAPTAETRSGEDGRYRLTGLAAGVTVHLIADESNHMPAPAQLQPRADIVSHVDFDLAPIFTLKVKVVDEQSRPIAGVTVVCGGTTAYLKSSSKLTDEDGQAIFHRGTLAGLSVTKSGYVAPDLIESVESGSRDSRTLTYVLKPNPTARIAGAASYSGIVLSADGRPIPGAAVTYGPISLAATVIPGQPIPDVVGLRQLKPVTVQTGPDGRYRLEAPQYLSNTMLSVEAKGWAPAAQATPAPGGNGDPNPAILDFKLDPGNWLSGRVVDAHGIPLIDCPVTLGGIVTGAPSESPYPPLQRSVKTDARGAFRFDDLRIGQYFATASLIGYPNASSPPSGVQSMVEIKMLPYGSFRGRVVDADSSEAIKQFIVTRGATLGGGRGGRGGRRGGVPVGGRPNASDPNAQVYTTPDGRFRLEDLDPNRPLDLSVSSEGYADRYLRQLPVGDETSAEVVFALGKRRSLTLRIMTGGVGVPIAGARAAAGVYLSEPPTVAWSPADSTAGMTQPVTLVSDGNGGVTIPELDPAACVLIQAKGYANKCLIGEERARLPQRDGVLQIEMERGASLEGSAAIGGKAYPNIAIILRMDAAQGRPGQRIRVTSDASGRYRFDDLAAGDYRIDQTPGRGDALPYQLGLKFKLSLGEDRTLDLVPPSGVASLSGRIVEGGMPVARAAVSLMPKFDPTVAYIAVQCDEQGNFALSSLAAGDYTVQAGPPVRTAGQQPWTTEVRIEGAMQRDFELVPPTTASSAP